MNSHDWIYFVVEPAVIDFVPDFRTAKIAERRARTDLQLAEGKWVQ